MKWRFKLTNFLLRPTEWVYSKLPFYHQLLCIHETDTTHINQLRISFARNNKIKILQINQKGEERDDRSLWQWCVTQPGGISVHIYHHQGRLWWTIHYICIHIYMLPVLLNIRCLYLSIQYWKYGLWKKTELDEQTIKWLKNKTDCF